MSELESFKADLDAGKRALREAMPSINASFIERGKAGGNTHNVAVSFVCAFLMIIVRGAGFAEALSVLDDVKAALLKAQKMGQH